MLRNQANNQFNRHYLEQQHQDIVTAFIVIMALLLVAMLMPSLAMAGTDTTFNTATTKVTDLISGSGGKLIALLSLVGGVAGAVGGKFGWTTAAIPIGTGVAVGLGPSIVSSTVTALI